MTSQTAKALHGLVIAVGMGLATALETRFLTGLPETAAAWPDRPGYPTAGVSWVSQSVTEDWCELRSTQPAAPTAANITRAARAVRVALP